MTMTQEEFEQSHEKINTFVTKAECMEAIEYLYGMGVENMRSDEAHYTMILIKKVARIYKEDLWREKN